MLGVPATIVNSDDEVQATREQRAQMEQQQQMMLWPSKLAQPLRP